MLITIILYHSFRKYNVYNTVIIIIIVYLGLFHSPLIIDFCVHETGVDDTGELVA